jgi:hypothetical protein
MSFTLRVLVVFAARRGARSDRAATRFAARVMPAPGSDWRKAA